jgi:alkanesulfonate monooxygenase SsuD/methylene tetrahydromethanopterin reductase-like flavin-dependent oxidoreductase (luciferase family)
MPPLSLAFDMRVPDLGTSPTDIYGAALDMCKHVDGRGFDYAWVMEHHAASDGYLPSPLTMAAAIAACTKQIRLLAGVIILPLHDPVKVAEDIAVVDLISNGRLDVAFGAGYVPREFAMFNRDVHRRGQALDEGVPIIQRALAGERFQAGGREIFVRPLPVQKPVSILMGGGVPATAKRAARFDAGLCPMTPAIVPIYHEECAKLGKKPGKIIANIAQIHVTEDPERTWHEIKPHVTQFVRSYAEFTEGAAQSGSPYEGMKEIDLAMIKKSGILSLVTPDEAVMLVQQADQMGAGLSLHPLLGGMSPTLGFESIDLFINKVLPRIHSARRAMPRSNSRLADPNA